MAKCMQSSAEICMTLQTIKIDVSQLCLEAGFSQIQLAKVSIIHK